MLNIDPLLFQPKVIRMSTTSSIGLPGQHIIRTTEYSNSQVMAGTHTRNEANNNVIISHGMDLREEFDSRTTEYRNSPEVRSYNSNETEKVMSTLEDGDTSGSRQADWTTDQMCWSGDGDISDSSLLERIIQQNSASVMSFESNLSSSTATASFHSQMSENTESKEELIGSLLNKIRSHSNVEASKLLLAMSSSVDNCIAMRQSGYLPLLVQLLHSPEENANDSFDTRHSDRINFEVRERIIQVMHNVVFSQPDDKTGRREARVLRLLEQIRDYCDQLRNLDADIDDNRNARCVDQHLGPSVAALMKLSFDEDHRYAMCQLGGLQAIAELMQIDHEVHGCTNDQYCITIRRYGGMALTNLTFGDGANKALLCSMRPFMEALVAQLYSPSEDLRQVTASVLRNLSWRADTTCKRILREVGAVTTLMRAAMEAEKESTLKSILSALWNLSAHCSGNKADICHVDGALAFLVGTLTYNSRSKTLAIVENGGGILRSVSSHIAIQNDYRVILRKHNCLQTLLKHLKSPSLTVVSNACGTLWNLSARNAVDQRALWEMGAVSMLKKLINSKHKMISMGSSAALKNLLSSNPPGLGLGLCVNSDSYSYNADMPSLHVRKLKALSTEIDQNLSETYDNTDSPKTSPSKHDKGNRIRRHMSPSAYGMTAQKMNRQRNEIINSQSRKSEEEKPNSTLVVEEKHNGAFQVTKNAKQALNYRQEQQRVGQESKDNVSYLPRRSIERSETTRMDTDCESTLRASSPRNVRPNEKIGHYYNADEQSSPKHCKAVNGDRNARGNMPSQLAAKKEYTTPERQTISDQRARTSVKEEQCNMAEQSLRPSSQISGQSPAGKTHESRIPLPRSLSKTIEPQRSLSASPVAQRRAIPQRLEPSQNVNSRTVDQTITHPKYAWNASYEKEDKPEKQNEPEESKNLTKRHSRCDYAKEQVSPPQHWQESKPYSTHVNRALSQDYCYSSDEEVKVCKPENMPKTSTLISSAQNVEEVETPSRCSLNIRTTTNVVLTRTHPLLSNIQQRDDESNVKLFEPRQEKRDGRSHHEIRGKTVVFDDDDEEFEIEETLSMLSRTSSVASISSFDQQSEQDDESLASDVSRHSGGIESPSELLDSPCLTAPSSPQKAISSDRIASAAVEGGVDEAYSDDVIDEVEGLSIDDPFNPSDDTEEHHMTNGKRHPTAPVTQSAVQIEENAITPENRNCTLKDDSTVATNEDESVSSPQDEYVESRETLSDRSTEIPIEKEDRIASDRASKSISVESLEVISPIEKTLIEECFQTGSQKADLFNKTSGAKQKTTQLSYQVLRDTIERHPNCTRAYETDRGKSLRNFEAKEFDYESLSDNEEKGKEDERKAEKNKLFRIPESPVDKKFAAGMPVDTNETKILSKKSIRNSQENKPVADRNSTQPIPSQLDFLMSNKNQPTSTPGKQVTDTIHNADGLSKGNVINVKVDCVRKEDEFSSLDDEVLQQKNKNESVNAADSNSEAVKALELSTNDPDIFQKDAYCSDKDVNGGDIDECMLTSSMLCEAKEIADALLGARVDSTEDMTVSTLSCLSDIDNARPPSVMAELGSLSMTSSFCDESLKAAVSKECQKLFGKNGNKQSSSSKKSLLRELQKVRMNSDYGGNDNSKGSSDSPDNMSLKSSCTSDLLGNINQPTIMDDMSLTGSMGSLSELECDPAKKVVGPAYSSNQDSISERMNDAAAMAQLYAKEFSNITGNCKVINGRDAHTKVTPTFQEVMEITVADVTEMGCDTIGSDTELDDDFPCDDEDPGSDTLQAPFQSSLLKEETGEGSTENLTLTLTEEPARVKDMSPYQCFEKSNSYRMTADEFRALQENADMIVNTLKTVQISDCGDMGGLSSSDMLDDETMSLVSNESDEEFLSPDGTFQNKAGYSHKGFPRSDFQMSPNGMLGLPQSNGAHSKYLAKKNSAVPQFPVRKKSIPTGLPSRSTVQNLKTRYMCPGNESSNLSDCYSITGDMNSQMNSNATSGLQIKVPLSKKIANSMPPTITHAESMNSVEDLNTYTLENGVFDTGTFTKKKPTIPKNRIPHVQSAPPIPLNSVCQPAKSDLVRSPSANSSLSSLSSNSEVTTSSSKTVESKIAATWKNSAKPRSKSAVDPNRNGKLRLDSTASSGSNSSISSKDDDKSGVSKLRRSSMQSTSPKKSLSRSSTQEKLNDEDEAFKSQSIGRPSTLSIAPKLTNRDTAANQRCSGKPESLIKTQKAEDSITRTQQLVSAILSPTSNQNGIPKLQNKAQGSLIPSRRSMIPKPGKFGGMEN